MFQIYECQILIIFDRIYVAQTFSLFVKDTFQGCRFSLTCEVLMRSHPAIKATISVLIVPHQN